MKKYFIILYSVVSLTNFSYISAIQVAGSNSMNKTKKEIKEMFDEINDSCRQQEQQMLLKKQVQIQEEMLRLKERQCRGWCL